MTHLSPFAFISAVVAALYWWFGLYVLTLYPRSPLARSILYLVNVYAASISAILATRRRCRSLPLKVALTKASTNSKASATSMPHAPRHSTVMLSCSTDRLPSQRS